MDDPAEHSTGIKRFRLILERPKSSIGITGERKRRRDSGDELREGGQRMEKILGEDGTAAMAVKAKERPAAEKLS